MTKKQLPKKTLPASDLRLLLIQLREEIQQLNQQVASLKAETGRLHQELAQRELDDQIKKKIIPPSPWPFPRDNPWDPWTSPQSKCIKCGLALDNVIYYCCTDAFCPSGLGPVCVTSVSPQTST